MKQSPHHGFPAEKTALHPRNRHRGRYDFPQLIGSSPALAPFVRPNAYGDLSIDFADPAAVRALNGALLKHFYGLAHWNLPAGYLCPPIPGRADYLHYLADLLADDHGGVIPRGPGVRVLDVGTGASCIYPIIGHHEYGWRFVGSEADAVAVRAAQEVVAANPELTGAVEIRRQPNPTAVFAGIIGSNERFDLTLCNPPFHASAAEAAAGTRRKLTNLGAPADLRPARNFGGQAPELWCPGGEAGFVDHMVAESARLPDRCRWFTTLLSSKDSLPGVYHALHRVGALDVRTVGMAQGQKASRFVAWTFLAPAQRAAWVAKPGAGGAAR